MEVRQINFGKPVYAVEKVTRGQFVVFEDHDDAGFYVRLARKGDLNIQCYLVLDPVVAKMGVVKQLYKPTGRMR